MNILQYLFNQYCYFFKQNTNWSVYGFVIK